MQCIVKDSRYHTVMLFMRITILDEIFCNVFFPIQVNFGVGSC